MFVSVGDKMALFDTSYSFITLLHKRIEYTCIHSVLHYFIHSCVKLKYLHVIITG